MEKIKAHSLNPVQQNITNIREMFPSCVTETKNRDGQIILGVDFDQLRQELSEHIVDGPQERYHLNWPGKLAALLTANTPPSKTLRPYPEESIEYSTTRNLFIEGDNLDALKLIQETYLSKVKLIYIDPPYNTGSDFIYKDKFSKNTSDYLRISNQIGDEGNRLVANTESNGRFHSDWLSMMYPRLKLARNLLCDDGAIFVSIGVEELSNLKLIMDEIYGESNFIEIFSWVKTSTPPGLSAKSRKTNEYILCYEKCRNSLKYCGEPLDGGDQPLLNTGNSIGKLKFPKDKVFFRFMNNGELKAGKHGRVELDRNLTIENGYAKCNFELSGEFKWTQKFLDEELQNGTTFIIKSDKFSIRFIRSGEGYKRPTNFIKEKYTNPIIDKTSCKVETNESASSDLRNLMQADVFSNPKPVSLIKHLLNFIVEEDDIVMDFFAGSGTTAEAVFHFSVENKIRVQYILIQLPENLELMRRATNDSRAKGTIKNCVNLLNHHNKPPLLTELTKLRIRAAGELCRNQDSNSQMNQDFGFRVLKVDSSNIADVYHSPDATEQTQLKLLTDNFKTDRRPDDLLFHVMLDLGIDLSLPIKRESINGKTIYFVNQSPHDLVACFDTGVDEDLVNTLARYKPQRIVFRDTGFYSDAIKINVEQIFRQVSPSTMVKSI